MKVKVTIEVFSDANRLLSKQALDILNLNNEVSLGAKNDMDILDYQRINSRIEQELLQAKINQIKPLCGKCGSGRVKKNGKAARLLKTLNGNLKLKLPKIYCHKCKTHTIVGQDKLPKNSNINPDLERTVLELLPVTTSYEALSELLFKLKGINISPKEIERIVIQRGKQIKNLQTDEYTRIDEVIKDLSPQPADKLYVSSDGTYVHSAEKDSRSFEGKFGVVFTDTKAHLSKNRNLLLNKRYCSSFYGKEDFAEQLNLIAYKMGKDLAKETIYICDGDRTLWKIKQEHFPDARGILDWMHISRNLHKALRVLEDKPKRKKKTRQLKHLLYHGQVQETLKKFKRLINQLKKDKQILERKLKLLTEFKDYIQNNQRYIINYNQARKNGYLISSSVMEGTINSLAANRLKKNRSRKWIRQGADGVSRVITCIKNNEWEKTWNQIYQQNFNQN